MRRHPTGPNNGYLSQFSDAAPRVGWLGASLSWTRLLVKGARARVLASSGALALLMGRIVCFTGISGSVVKPRWRIYLRGR